MKHLWHYFLMAALLTACSSTEDPNTTAPSQTDDPGGNTDPGDPPGGNPDATTCQTLACPHGCCNNQCVNLESDADHCGRCDTKCDNYCLNGQCVTSCSGENTRVCAMTCVDLSKNSDHCGACNVKCGPNMMCDNKACKCYDGYSDCDGNALNGCESMTYSCECTNGETAPCYPEEPATENVGRCRPGITVCEEGMFLYCENWIGPTVEIPGNHIDDDCDGVIDELIDNDGDGYYYGVDDCCDDALQCGVYQPEKVNPGAHEVPGNGIDDNCNGLIDEDLTTLCSKSAATFKANTPLTDNDAVLLARAMDICEDAATSGYGLVSAQFLLADGSPLPASCNTSICGKSTTHISPAEQAAVATDLGGIVRPLKGTMAVLSSGKAQGKENTGFRDCSGTEVEAPKAFLNAHNGTLPVSNICYDASAQKHRMANDSIMLRLKLKAPSNAKGFSFRFKFFSKEYPAYVCQNYNDFFLAMTDASDKSIPLDKNVSFDSKNNPVSVNNAFFTECDPNACTKTVGCSDCKDGSENILAYVSNPNQAGATGWLKTSVPVAAGEEFTLDLIIFDGGDRGNKTDGWGHQRDSLVLLDNFEWNYDSTTLITVVN